MYPSLASTVARNQKCLDYSIPFISFFHFPMFWKALNTEEYNAVHVKLNSCRQTSSACQSFCVTEISLVITFLILLNSFLTTSQRLLIPIFCCKDSSLWTCLSSRECPVLLLQRLLFDYFSFQILNDGAFQHPCLCKDCFLSPVRLAQRARGQTAQQNSLLLLTTFQQEVTITLRQNSVADLNYLQQY